MKRSELTFDYPEDLVATEPLRPSRVLWIDENPSVTPVELTFQSLKSKFNSGDVLLINDTKVEPRRVVAKNKDGEPVEVLFVHRVGMSLDSRVWEVLAPTRSFKGYSVIFPEDISAKIIVGGRPQHLELSRTIDESYFLRHGEMPLPPTHSAS